MLSVYILLDRSGSMASRWKESIDSINEYVNVLKNENGVEGKITLIAFDHNVNTYATSTTQFGTNNVWWNSDIVPVEHKKIGVSEIVRENVPISNWTSLTGSEVTPRGSTPLFDAVVEAKVLMQKDNSERGIFLIITDGGENCSKNRKESAEGAISYVKSRGWEATFLGANFDNSKDAKGMGLGRENYASYLDGSAVQTMNYMATRSASYATTGASMALSDADRKKNKLT